MMLATYATGDRPREGAVPRPATAGGARDRRAYEDLFFALTTSTEALTNH